MSMKYRVGMVHAHTPAAVAASHTVGFDGRVLRFSFGFAETSDESLVKLIKEEYSSMYSVEPVSKISEPSEPLDAGVLKPRDLKKGEVLEDATPEFKAVHPGLPLSSEPISPEDVSPFAEEPVQEEESSPEEDEEEEAEADIGIVSPAVFDVYMPSTKAISKARKSRSLRKVVGYLVEAVLPYLDADEMSRDKKVESLYAMLIQVRKEEKIALLDKPKKKLLKTIETFVPAER